MLKKPCIFLSKNRLLLVQKNAHWQFPAEDELILSKDLQCFPMNDFTGFEYVVAEIAPELLDAIEKNLIDLREAYHFIGEELFYVAGRARQLLDWRNQHQFCGQCGSRTEFFDQGRAKKCMVCGLVNYPKISPCMLVAITRGDEILLAAHVHQSRKNLYTVLAGFLEPGETIEGGVHREVMEEVGVKIKNLCYIASQPWPFPNLLMVGFIAEYESGEIKIDQNELLDARWFHRDNMPTILPLKMTLSFTLIEHFLQKRYRV